MNSTSVWWASEGPHSLISGPRLISAWTTALFGASLPTSQQLQSLADLSKKLWSQFTTNREALDRDYMSDEKQMSAYFASFFIPNIERTRSALLEQRLRPTLQAFLQQETLEVLDFGSGPLSASIGLLLALSESATTGLPGDMKTKSIRIIAVERSEKAVKRAQAMIAQCTSSNIDIKIERVTSIPSQQSFDCVLAANVINEIPEKHRVKTVVQLLSRLNSERINLGLILEPGQEDHSRHLSALRDNLLQDHQHLECAILAPCPHHKSCPLSPKTQRSDWCWFRTNFKTPHLLQELDRRSHVDHSSLAYSYLAMSRPSANEKALLEKRTWAICVSDEMSVGKPADTEKRLAYFSANSVSEIRQNQNTLLRELAENGTKTKLCRASGDYQSGLRMKSKESPSLRRGEVMTSEIAFDAIINER